MGEVTRGDRTREAILVAAREHVAEHGFERATLGRIAADAGVTQGTVVFHFGSKAGLLAALLGDHYDRLLADLDEVLDPAAPPAERLATFARWWLARNAEDFPLLSVFARHGRRTEPDEIVAAFGEANRRVTRRFEALVEDLKHAGVVAPEVPTRIVRDAFFGTTEHLVIGRVLTGRPEDLDGAAADVVALLLRGGGRDESTAPGVEERLRAVEEKLDRLLARG